MDVSYRHCAKDSACGGHPARPLRAYKPCPYAELERCPWMDECPCSQGWREGTVAGTERGVTQVFTQVLMMDSRLVSKVRNPQLNNDNTL